MLLSLQRAPDKFKGGNYYVHLDPAGPYNSVCYGTLSD